MSESEDTDIIPAPTSIVRAPTGITALNSSLARPAIPSQDSLAKVTHYKLDLDTILDGLIPDPLPESGGKDNAIHHLNIIIFGKPNTGKTTLAESICGLTRTCYLSEALERLGRLMRIRSRRCLAQSSTMQCASMRSTRFGTGKNLHGPLLWQRPALGSSVFHAPQSLQSG